MNLLNLLYDIFCKKYKNVMIAPGEPAKTDEELKVAETD